jgi:glucokinase
MVQIGFDIGGSKIAAGVVDEENKILARREIPFPLGASYQSVVITMAAIVKELLKATNNPESELESIGLSIPGEIDDIAGTIVHAYNLQFHNVPIRKEMEEYFEKVPVFIANDANAAALAELYAGAFRGCRTAVLLTLGTGIGGGIILDGKLFNGGMNHGVELGHMTLQYNGLLCTCGNRGCVETICTATWLIAQGRQALKEHPDCLIAKKAKGLPENINAKLVIDCAREEDAVAKDIFDRYVDQLSSAIASCTVMLDPEVIALGGGVSHAGEFLLAPVRKLVEQKSFFHFPYKVVQAEHGNDSGIIGAAMLVHNAKKGIEKT